MLTWLLKNPAVAACGVVIVALLGLTTYLGVQSFTLVTEKAALTSKVSAYETENERLKLDKALLDHSVKNLKVEIDMTKKTQEELTKVLSDLIPKAAQDAARLKDIENAPASDDGPLAPVLRRALDGLRP